MLLIIAFFVKIIPRLNWVDGMILPVIIAGGVGSRLWPVSKDLLPKQFICFPQFKESLFQKTVKRIAGIPNVLPPLVICGKSHHPLVGEQLRSIEQSDGTIMLEPIGRGTAPACAMAALLAKQRDPDTQLLVLPADHLIRDLASFRQAIKEAIPAALEGYLVTFGIKPETASTGYGYIEKGEQIDGTSCFEVSRFAEKPEKSVAESYLQDGGYFWNSGMFLMTAQTYLDELEKHAFDVFKACTRSFESLIRKDTFLEIKELDFSKCPNDSIDYAVMEKTTKAAMVTLDVGWNDLGEWDSFAAVSSKDESQNTTIGDVYVNDVRGSYIQANDRQVAALGIKDTVIVETADAVLVSSKNSVQDVKKIAESFKSEREEIKTPREIKKPWGFYRSLTKEDGYQVKKLFIKPGESLSLQRHKHRAEHWVIINGKGIFTCGEKEITLSKNENLFIPAGEKHRVANPFSENLEIIEVQVGDYLGEDDIERLDDKYGRQD